MQSYGSANQGPDPELFYVKQNRIGELGPRRAGTCATCAAANVAALRDRLDVNGR